jgi:hypothetical protein
MVAQINDLLSRQSELDTANANADAKYKLISAQLAREAEEQNKPEEAKVLRTLSSFGYNEYWKSAVESSQDYIPFSQIKGTSMMVDATVIFTLKHRACALTSM